MRTDAGFWAVADGMGGHEAGDLASRILVESLDAIERPEAALDLLEQCEAQIFRANQRIVGLEFVRATAQLSAPRPRFCLSARSIMLACGSGIAGSI